MTWTANWRIPGQLSKATPTLAFDERWLHMVHLGDSSNHLWHSYVDGDYPDEIWRRPDTGKPGNYPIPDQLSKASPALTAFGGLHMVHLGDNSNHIWHSYSDGGTWRRPDTGEPGNYPIPDQLSRATPALSTVNLVIVMVHLGDDSNELWESEFSPLGPG